MLVAVVMGSKSDWGVMIEATQILSRLNIDYETKVVSAHRTPDLLFQFAEMSDVYDIIIAGAGGSAHLPGMLAAKTLVPVLGVPIASGDFTDYDAQISMLCLPLGTPVAVFPGGAVGACNAALFAARMLLEQYGGLAEGLRARILKFHADQAMEVMSAKLE